MPAGAGRGVLQPAVKGTDVKNEESLGQKMIDGVLADGKRVTTVLPAGSIGNQQPITVLSEQWFAPDLEILVMTKHSDPRTGETTYSLSNITRGEPAAGLFDVPPDYTIQDSSYIRTPAVSVAPPFERRPTSSWPSPFSSPVENPWIASRSLPPEGGSHAVGFEASWLPALAGRLWLS